MDPRSMVHRGDPWTWGPCFVYVRQSETLRITPSKPQEKRECRQELVPRGTRVKKPLLFGSTSCLKSPSPKFKVNILLEMFNKTQLMFS